jgi:hypothetical protein
MSPKMKTFLIVALVLFLCCFGGSIGNPFGGDDDDNGQNNGLVDFLSKFGGDAGVVPDDAVQAPCKTAPSRFEFTGSCTLTVEGGGTGLRNLVLRGNRAMTVTARVPRDDFDVSDDVEPDEQVKVAIDEDGGQVRLACPALQTCIVLREDGS